MRRILMPQASGLTLNWGYTENDSLNVAYGVDLACNDLLHV